MEKRCVRLQKFMDMQIILGGPVVRPLAARAKGPEFDSPIAQHVQGLISQAFTYGAVGSLVSS